MLCDGFAVFSSCASAAGHQKFVKPPVTAKAQSKGSQKRKKDAGMRTDGRKVAQVKAHPLKTHPLKTMRAAPLSLASASKSMQPKDRLQTVRQGVVSKLMKQLGKPYRYGGESPITGFDCSGLVNYAYRDKLKSTLPRTANSMYHMPSQKAKRVGKTELNAGDLVFFHTHGRGTEHADHVGVYLGGESLFRRRVPERIFR